MKLLQPENDNYAAVVVSLKSIIPLEGCDNVVGTAILGFQAIVGKDSKVGDLGIAFPAETQLSEEYAYENNLHRHADKNRDEGAKGYLEDNRRIRAMKFRGHRSDCLFAPLDSLSYIKKLKLADLKEGDTFDRIGDNLICNKYVVKRPRREVRLEKNKEKFVRVDKKYLPEHYDSDNYFRNQDVIPENKDVVVTQKLHGTSIRVGNTIVARRPSFIERCSKVLGVNVKDQEYDYVFGSRKVIKDANNPNQNHFYETDIWTTEGKRLEGTIPEGYLLYGELIGWTEQGAAIQKNYTYKVPVNTADLYIYRVAFVNPQGLVADLSWDQVREFCQDRGLKTVPELWRGKYKDFNPFDFVDGTGADGTKYETLHKYLDDGYPGAVPLDKESPVDEGVCIRVDGIAPYILKAKSAAFYEHETKMLDEEALDLEAEGSES